MNLFPVGSPQTIFDWAAIRDHFRSRSELLGFDVLCVLYGLSMTERFRDDEFVQEVDESFTRVKDPVRTRFEFAYQLGSEFWDTYSIWELSNAEEPDYPGAFVDGFHDKVLSWILEGLAAYSDEMAIMDQAYYLVSRIGNFDTFLDEQDIFLMETAAKKEISLETSEGGRRMIEHLINVFNDQYGDAKKKKDPTDYGLSSDTDTTKPV
jgi:hypothetical protein